MPNNVITSSGPPSDQLDRITGVVLTGNEDLGQKIVREIQPFCHIKTITKTVDDALGAVQSSRAKVLYAHLTKKTRKTGMALIRRLRRPHPEIIVFIISDSREPDLILEGFRLGIADFLPPVPDGNGWFLAALRKAMGHQETGGRNGFVYSVFSLKGGQGTTSLTLNLADQIRLLTGDRVLLLDLNLYMGDMITLLNLSAAFTPYNLIRNLSRMDENLLFSSLTEHARGFHIIPSPQEISDAESIHRDQITAMLTLLKRHFAHIVIDLSHDFSERTLSAVEASDRVMVLVEPNLMSVKSAQQILSFFQELNYSEDRISIVLNRLDKKSILHPEDVQSVMKQPLFATISNDWSALTQAGHKGDPLGVAHSRRRITRELHQLAGRLTGMADAGARQGAFRRWLGLNPGK